MNNKHHTVHGIGLDNETRCTHYHNESEDHTPVPWSKSEFDEHAILCGVCDTTLSIKEYMETDHCPHCDAQFNPRCAAHYPLYFDV